MHILINLVRITKLCERCVCVFQFGRIKAGVKRIRVLFGNIFIVKRRYVVFASIFIICSSSAQFRFPLPESGTGRMRSAEELTRCKGIVMYSGLTGRLRGV